MRHAKAGTRSGAGRAALCLRGVEGARGCVQPCWPHGGPRGEHVSTAPQAGHGSSSLSSQVGAAGGVVIGGAAAARSSPLLLVDVGPLMTASRGYGGGVKREMHHSVSLSRLTSTLHERDRIGTVARSPVMGCRP